MRDKFEFEINGTAYNGVQWGARAANRRLAKVGEIVGPVIVGSQEDDVAQAIQGACKKLADKASEDFLLDLFDNVYVKKDDKIYHLSNGEAFDDHFAGRIGEIYVALFKVLENNVGNFSEVAKSIGDLASNSNSEV